MTNLLEKLNQKRQGGFTIIEVMIVLAIAGLIIAVVLVAIPQLQRNQRNESRRNVLGRIKTEIDNYAGNNNGQYPAANTAAGATNLGSPTAGNGFFTRYLGCAATSPATCTVDINDARTGFPVGTGTGGTAVNIRVATTDTAPDIAAGDLLYRTGQSCNGEALQASTGRAYALMIRLEGGAIYCLDNE